MPLPFKNPAGAPLNFDKGECLAGNFINQITCKHDPSIMEPTDLRVGPSLATNGLDYLAENNL